MKNWIGSLLALWVVALAASGHAGAQSWQPSDQQKTAVVALAHAYFAALDGGDYDQAVGYMTPAMRDRIRIQDIRAAKADEAQHYGRVAERRVASVSWYPTGSRDGTGVAAGVDFQARTDGDAILCGYLSVIERTENQFEVLRAESTALLRSDAAKMSPEKLVELLNRPGCRVFLQQ